MKPNSPSETVIAAKVPRTVAEALRRAAREDDRTPSSWLRRHLADVFGISTKPAPVEPTVDPR